MWDLGSALPFQGCPPPLCVAVSPSQSSVPQLGMKESQILVCTFQMRHECKCSLQSLLSAASGAPELLMAQLVLTSSRHRQSLFQVNLDRHSW